MKKQEKYGKLIKIAKDYVEIKETCELLTQEKGQLDNMPTFQEIHGFAGKQLI